MLGNSPISAVLPTTDIARARQFYVETLGLTEVPIQITGSEGNLILQSGGTTVVVYYREEPTKAEHTAAGWMVEDIDAVIDGLIARGITFETYPDLPGATWDERGVSMSEDGLKGAWFKDPDGNILGVAQAPG